MWNLCIFDGFDGFDEFDEFDEFNEINEFDEFNGFNEFNEFNEFDEFNGFNGFNEFNEFDGFYGFYNECFFASLRSWKLKQSLFCSMDKWVLVYLFSQSTQSRRGFQVAKGELVKAVQDGPLIIGGVSC